MIEFVSLLLGLVIGVQAVEVQVAEPVARVEMVLDGEVVAAAAEPPWSFDVDLGSELAPHELAAVARDAVGREIGRAVQFVNLPRPVAEARWSFENDERGLPAVALLAWEHLWSRPPQGIEVQLDGEPLAAVAVAAELYRVELPGYDAGELHLLTAELRFPDDGRAHAEAVFGGVYGERVETELTALPIVYATRRPPTVLRLAGSFRRDGRELEVAAVERSGADVVVVRDEAAQVWLARRVAEQEERMRGFHLTRSRLHDLLPLGAETRLRFVWPSRVAVAEGSGLRIDPEQFAAPLVHPGDGPGLAEVLAGLEAPPVPQRVADAVAIAGVVAATGNRPRAVVLAFDPGTPDSSRHRPDEVRRFLARLHVPLFVWSIGGDAGPEWGEVAPIGGWEGLQQAVRQVRRTIDSQAVVWLDGRHPPQAVELAAGERRWELAR